MENDKIATNKKMLVPIIIIVVIVLALVAVISFTKKSPSAPVVDQNTPVAQTEGEVDANAPIAPEVIASSSNPELVGATTQAPGADFVTTAGKVVTQEGAEVKTDVAYNSPEAPKQTMPVAIKDVPSAIKLTLDANGYSPKEFKVKKGAAVTLALTAVGEDVSHVLAFRDKALQAVYINVRPNETRAVTFNAPTTAGSYEYFCDFPGHSGEIGTMIVE